MDKEILLQQRDGLRAAIKDAREAERILIKANTLAEQVEKARVDRDPFEKRITEIKEEKAKLKTQKTTSLSGVAAKLQGEITKLLPDGEAVLRIDDDGIFIGLKREKGITPYLSLSGGERAFYDAALANALLGDSQNKIIVGEVAEVDSGRMSTLLKEISTIHPNVQFLFNSCHAPAEIPDDWHVEVLS
jgi:hypothetical protein